MAVGFLLYAPSMTGGFVFDDHRHLVNNFALRNAANWLMLWKTSKSRFLTHLTFSWNYHFHGLQPFGYHAVNVLLHVTNAFLVFLLVRCLEKTNYATASVGALSHNPTPHFAFFSGTIFLIHPLQTQAVSYIVQRATLLACFFYLSTVILYSHWRQSKSKLCYRAALALAFLGMFTKPIILTLPAALLIIEALFFTGERRKPVRSLLFLSPFAAMAFLIPVFFYQSDLFTSHGHAFVPGETQTISSWHYFLTEMRVILTYLRLFFLPLNLNLDYDYPILTHFFDPRVLSGILTVTALLFLAFWSLSRNRFVSFGLFWFFLTVSLESSIFPIRDVINEHRLYLPMAGASMATMAVPYHKMFRLHLRSSLFLRVLLTIVIASLSLLTYSRNQLWADPVRLWADTARKSPLKARPWNNLAFEYARRGNYEQALKLNQRALELDPKYGETYFNLGVILMQVGEFEDAVAVLKKAANLVRFPAKVYNNLALAYALSQQFREAIRYGLMAVEKDPSLAPTYNILGYAYDHLGENETALPYYAKAVSLDPGYAEAWANLGILYGRLGDAQRMIHCCQKAATIDPTHQQALKCLRRVR